MIVLEIEKLLASPVAKRNMGLILSIWTSFRDAMRAADAKNRPEMERHLDRCFAELELLMNAEAARSPKEDAPS